MLLRRAPRPTLPLRALTRYFYAMTFRNDADFNTKTVKRGGGKGRGLAIGGGGGIVAVIAVVVISQLTGFDVSGLLAGGNGQQQEPGVEITGCTGADANDPANIDCRMEGGSQSLSTYWSDQLGGDYRDPEVVLFDDSVSTGCGQGSGATGPFYCSADESIYIDTSFFDDLRDRFGAEGGNLAEMYVLAHEWGHHVQFLRGELQQMNPQDTGPASSMVRGEVQADCYAGAWMNGATGASEDGAPPVMESVSAADFAQAIDAAGVIGDDRLQQSSGQGVNPDAWSHGSSEQRQQWLMAGFDGGPGACDTWSVEAP